MARSRRYRRSTRRPGKWSSNIVSLESAIQFTAGDFYTSTDLATNPAQTSSSVSQQYTVKNVEFTYRIELNNIDENRDLEMLQMYVVYIPQGFSITLNTIEQHPEWVMAYQFIGNPDSDAVQRYQPRKIKTRLARRLQTGDSIKLLIYGSNKSTSSLGGTVSGIVRWWTKAN